MGNIPYGLMCRTGVAAAISTAGKGFFGVTGIRSKRPICNDGRTKRIISEPSISVTTDSRPMAEASTSVAGT